MRQVILDTETTGLDPKAGHRLTEIGCLEMIDRRATGRVFQTYLNPEREIDEGAFKVTGQSLAFLQDKPKFSEMVHDFLDFIVVEGTELIIHNAPFDLGFLNHELQLLSHPMVPLEKSLPVIDTLLIARRLHPGKQNNLDALCKRYNVDNTDRDYHGALLDARLLMRVYLAMTAGQTEFNLNASADAAAFGSGAVSKRPAALHLPVIYATEAECQAHEAWMKRLKQPAA